MSNDPLIGRAMQLFSGVNLDLIATSLFLGGALLVLVFSLSSYMGILSSRVTRDHFYSGKHVLITGGSSGIGKELARLLIASGASVTLVARNPDRLNAAAAELTPPGESSAPVARVNVYSVDCSDPSAVEKMVDHVERLFGPIDILVNSAGQAIGGYFDHMQPASIRAQMDANYFTQAYPTLQIFKRMTKRRVGHIVIVSSVSGQLGVFGQSAYVSAKYALRGLAETLYFEGKPFGINVSVVFPPDTDTPGHKTELDTMPPETREISETGGLFSAETVAARIADGVMRKRFRICFGFIGKLLGILTAGYSPGVSLTDIFVVPIARALVPFFIWDQVRVIQKGHRERFPDAISRPAVEQD